MMPNCRITKAPTVQAPISSWVSQLSLAPAERPMYDTYIWTSTLIISAKISPKLKHFQQVKGIMLKSSPQALRPPNPLNTPESKHRPYFLPRRSFSQPIGSSHPEASYATSPPDQPICCIHSPLPDPSKMDTLRAVERHIR